MISFLLSNIISLNCSLLYLFLLLVHSISFVFCNLFFCFRLFPFRLCWMALNTCARCTHTHTYCHSFRYKNGWSKKRILPHERVYVFASFFLYLLQSADTSNKRNIDIYCIRGWISHHASWKCGAYNVHKVEMNKRKQQATLPLQ